MLAAVRRGSSLVGNPAGEYFFKVSNCAQKSSHLRFNFLSIGASPRPSPVSEAPEYRRRLRKRAPCFGALAIEPVESGTRHHVSIARRNINGCAVKLQAEPIATPVPCWCHLCSRRRRGRAFARYRPLRGLPVGRRINVPALRLVDPRSSSQAQVDMMGRQLS
jgi:hypothetical protein